MTNYLLAAEADKIQDLLFRSSRLREVVGGSRLLARFCTETVPELVKNFQENDHENNKEIQIIISEGGSFRLRFNNYPVESVRDFGNLLARTYREVLDSDLSVAKPVKIKGDTEKDEQEALEEAHSKLRRDKQNKNGHRAILQTPFTAICGSCGLGLAAEYGTLNIPQKDRDQAREMFLCRACLSKRKERAQIYNKSQTDNFTTPFHEAVVLSKKIKFEQAAMPEDIQNFDHRRYVAYLVADGNSMGEVFSSCPNFKTVHTLSDNLTKILRESLAKTTAQLMSKTGQRKDKTWLIPVLPLILAGDDLFALIPAKWSLDFARLFARNYEQQLAEFLKNKDIFSRQPSIGVAVVICKANYPYYLAHRIGEKLLQDGKIMSKRYAMEEKLTYIPSALNFEVIIGSQLAGTHFEQRKAEIRPTLRPYWVDKGNRSGWGLSITELILQRENLASIPKKRLAGLRSHFDNLPQTGTHKFAAWQRQLQDILIRVLEVSSEESEKKVTSCLESLGQKGAKTPELYEVDRACDKDIWYGHGLPDLLEAWDFSLPIYDRDQSDCEGQ